MDMGENVQYAIKETALTFGATEEDREAIDALLEKYSEFQKKSS